MRCFLLAKKAKQKLSSARPSPLHHWTGLCCSSEGTPRASSNRISRLCSLLLAQILTLTQPTSLSFLALSPLNCHISLTNSAHAAANTVHHLSVHKRSVLLVLLPLLACDPSPRVSSACEMTPQLTQRCPHRLYCLLGESLTEPDARSWMFYDWDKVNRAGISFRLLSIFLEDLPQLVIQGVAAARSNETVSPIAVASIALTSMCAAHALLVLCCVPHNNAPLRQISRAGRCRGNR